MTMVTRYMDRYTGEMVLKLDSTRPLEVIMEGMLFRVQSRTRGHFEEMFKSGNISQERFSELVEENDVVDEIVLDLEVDFGLAKLQDRLKAADVNEYLCEYWHNLHMQSWDNINQLKFVKDNMPNLYTRLCTRIPKLHAYSTQRGSTIFAVYNQDPEPPTFLYLEFALKAHTDIVHPLEAINDGNGEEDEELEDIDDEDEDEDEHEDEEMDDLLHMLDQAALV